MVYGYHIDVLPCKFEAHSLKNEQVMVNFVNGESGIYPELESVVGVIEGDERWKDFLEGDSQTAWDSLLKEAKETWEVLGKEPFGPLSSEVNAVGGSSVDGSTRKWVQQQ